MASILRVISVNRGVMLVALGDHPESCVEAEGVL